HVEETMDLSREVQELHRHKILLESPSVVFAFPAKDVVLGSDHEGWSDTSKRSCPHRRGIWLSPPSPIRHVRFPDVPDARLLLGANAVSTCELFVKLFVGVRERRIHSRIIEYRIDEQLKTEIDAVVARPNSNRSSQIASRTVPGNGKAL